MADPESLSSYVNQNTKMVWVETPTNPMMNIIDLEAVAAFSKMHNLLLAVDNTFASPYLQNPLDFGADIVMHSVTKYLGGHSDVVMGALVVNDDELASRLVFFTECLRCHSRPARLLFGTSGDQDPAPENGAPLPKWENHR